MSLVCLAGDKDLWEEHEKQPKLETATAVCARVSVIMFLLYITLSQN